MKAKAFILGILVLCLLVFVPVIPAFAETPLQFIEDSAMTHIAKPPPPLSLIVIVTDCAAILAVIYIHVAKPPPLYEGFPSYQVYTVDDDASTDLHEITEMVDGTGIHPFATYFQMRCRLLP